MSDNPHGIVPSPDKSRFYVSSEGEDVLDVVDRNLYVTNWDQKKKVVVMRYDVKDDGTIGNGKVFFDMTAAPGEEALDGLKIDRAGNL